MALLRRARTLGAGLGSFATKIWRTIIGAGEGLAEAVGLGRAAGVEVEPTPTWHEGYEVRTAAGRQEQFAALEPAAFAPQEWYEQSTIPWDKPIAYKIIIYGRDLETGRFAHQELDITVSRPLTAEEAVNECLARVGMEGGSPLFDIFSAKLVGASRREGEPWRW